MELQPADSLKLIQDIIRQRKQKYEENGFFLIFWSVLICLSGIIQFVMLATDYYPRYSWIGWGVLMPLGFFISFFSKMKEGARNRKEQKRTDCYAGNLSTFLICILGDRPTPKGFLVGSDLYHGNCTHL